MALALALTILLYIVCLDGDFPPHLGPALVVVRCQGGQAGANLLVAVAVDSFVQFFADFCHVVDVQRSIVVEIESVELVFDEVHLKGFGMNGKPTQT